MGGMNEPKTDCPAEYGYVMRVTGKQAEQASKAAGTHARLLQEADRPIFDRMGGMEIEELDPMTVSWTMFFGKNVHMDEVEVHDGSGRTVYTRDRRFKKGYRITRRPDGAFSRDALIRD